MTKEAEIFKSKNFLNYEELSVSDFNKLPALTGIYNFTAGKYKFNLICIKNDDTSVVSYFGKVIMIK